LTLVERTREILAEIHPATVRAVCYRLFTAGLIASMAKTHTNRVSSQLTWAREQGIIPWRWVVDETREAERAQTWRDPEAFIEAARRSYRRDRWAYQAVTVELWSEKGTVRGMLAPVLEDYGVTFRVSHGYASATMVKEAADESASDDREFIVLYVGDWDPSGLHMSEEDLPARLEEYGGSVELTRIALTAHDITNGGLPSFDVETKTGDTRFRWYVERYGRRCWELDALNPNILRRRVADAIASYIDMAVWTRCALGEQAEQQSLRQVLGQWATICGQATK
jgi:hypothetical protein